MILKINDRLKVRTIQYFNNFELMLKHDSLSSPFSFEASFDPDNHDHEELFCVSHYHEALIEHNGNQLLRGFIIQQDFKDSPTPEMAKFSGASLPCFLEHCNIPPEAYPLQHDGLSLQQIASKLIKPFPWCKMVVDPLVQAKMNIPFDKTSAEPTQKISEYLIDLCAQRNIILSHDTYGRVLFTQLKTNTLPIMKFSEGLIGTELSLSFQGQEIHSHITVMKQADSEGGNAGQYTIVNPYVPVAYTYRPKVVIQSSGDNTATKLVAKNALAAELRGVVLTINIDRWDLNNQLILPNSIISVISKKLYLYDETKFFVESAHYSGNSEALTATLTCVLPFCYDLSQPYNVFVDPHENSASGYSSPV
jgi:prophage tail gpP-like protein